MKAINHFKNETGKVSEVERAYGSGHANSEGRLVLQSEGAIACIVEKCSTKPGDNVDPPVCTAKPCYSELIFYT